MAHTINLPEKILDRLVECVVSTVPTDSIYLFGSYARGEETENSDIDIYVVTNKFDNNKIDYPAMADVGMALRWMNRPKDIFCLSKEEFLRRAGRNTGLERVVAREGVKIYER